MSAFKKKPSFLVLGVMSGTSTDGLDLALCAFERKRKNWDYRIVRAKTLKYPAGMKRFLLALPHVSAQELSAAHLKYGQYIAKAINKFLLGVPEQPMLIGSHGHTIFHRPEKLECFQLGHGGVIASLTGIPCVNDFRLQDIVLGGQGAPLVPLGDRELFSGYDAYLNLGGIANISFRKVSDFKAFDIVPCNLPLNTVISRVGKSYDRSGKMARKGKPDRDLLHALNELQYYQQNGPKSLGREWVEQDFMVVIQRFAHVSIPDLLATLCEHIAFQTGIVIRNNGIRRVLISGGGAHHGYLIERLRQHSEPAEILLPDPLTIDFKEALIFAFLGLYRCLSLPNTLPSVTGSMKESCSGSFWLP